MSDENWLILFSIYIGYCIFTIGWIMSILMKTGDSDEAMDRILELGFIEKCFIYPMLFKLLVLMFILEKLGIIKGEIDE